MNPQYVELHWYIHRYCYGTYHIAKSLVHIAKIPHKCCLIYPLCNKVLVIPQGPWVKDQDLPGPQIFAQWLDPCRQYSHCGYDTPHDLRIPPNCRRFVLRPPKAGVCWMTGGCLEPATGGGLRQTQRGGSIFNWRVWSMVYLVDLGIYMFLYWSICLFMHGIQVLIGKLFSRV